MLVAYISAFFWEIISISIVIFDIGVLFKEVISIILMILELNH
jgi:hypothetical protein